MFAKTAMRAMAFGVQHASAPVSSLLASRNIRTLARLAREYAIRSATARLQERLDQLKADHAAGRFTHSTAARPGGRTGSVHAAVRE